MSTPSTSAPNPAQGAEMSSTTKRLKKIETFENQYTEYSGAVKTVVDQIRALAPKLDEALTALESTKDTLAGNLTQNQSDYDAMTAEVKELPGAKTALENMQKRLRARQKVAEDRIGKFNAFKTALASLNLDKVSSDLAAEARDSAQQARTARKTIDEEKCS